MPHVLLVDDHELVRRGLQLVLAEGLVGATFRLAASGREALDALSPRAPSAASPAPAPTGASEASGAASNAPERAPFDLVVLDINLPGMSGIEVLEAVRRRFPRLPVLVVSAYPEEEFALRCLRLGAVGYLSKDTAADELVIAARKALAGGKYVSAAIAERLAGALAGESIGGSAHESLANRELEVLRLVATGKSQRAIAEALHLSEKTIATYRARLAEKLGASTNVELTRYAIHHGLVD
jgi:DNA-binding NarL/FixJ family response regulator